MFDEYFSPYSYIHRYSIQVYRPLTAMLLGVIHIINTNIFILPIDHKSFTFFLFLYFKNNYFNGIGICVSVVFCFVCIFFQWNDTMIIKKFKSLMVNDTWFVRIMSRAGTCEIWREKLTEHVNNSLKIQH